MKIYPYFFRNRQNKDGMFPVYIYITRNSRRFCVNSGISSSCVFEGNIFPISEKNHRNKTKALTDMIDDIENLALENINASDKQLKLLIETRILKKKRVEGDTLAEIIRTFGKTHNNQRTRELYDTTANKVAKFDKDATLDVDKAWLESLENSFVNDNIKVNAYAIHMRNIRATFNWAIEKEMTTNYPFKAYKIKSERTRKRNLPAEFIRNLTKMDVKPSGVRYKDFFLLSLYLIGINPVDILTAKHSQLIDGRLYYNRHKTHKEYSVKVEPEAMELINKYKGRDYLLKFCDTSNYKHFLKRCNNFLRTIRPDLTMYWARHSFASIAVELDIPIEMVSAALGHSHGEEVTQIYVNYEQKKVDKANRKVMDYILYNKVGD